MYKVYYTDLDTNTAHAFDTEDMGVALEKCKTLRKEGMVFVTMVAVDPGMVGQQGVDSVKDGKLPSGEDYTFFKKADSISARRKQL